MITDICYSFCFFLLQKSYPNDEPFCDTVNRVIILDSGLIKFCLKRGQYLLVNHDMSLMLVNSQVSVIFQSCKHMYNRIL